MRGTQFDSFCLILEVTLGLGNTGEWLRFVAHYRRRKSIYSPGLAPVMLIGQHRVTRWRHLGSIVLYCLAMFRSNAPAIELCRFPHQSSHVTVSRDRTFLPAPTPRIHSHPSLLSRMLIRYMRNAALLNLWLYSIVKKEYDEIGLWKLWLEIEICQSLH